MMATNNSRVVTGRPGNTSARKSLILIVDDIPENLQVLASYLSGVGYEVLPATSGTKALNFARVRMPDLILLDVSMPEMDGFEVCRCLKNMPELSHIPVLFITARTDTEDVVRGFNVGGVDYITKPFNSTELLARVHTHLELKSARDALLKYNQELTRQGDELRQLDQEKNRLLSIVSHDMRTSFGNVINVCESILQPGDLDSGLREERDEMLRLVAQEAEHMILLGENLLNADAISHGVLRLRPERLDPLESIGFVASKHRRSAALKRIAVTSPASPSTAVAVNADRTALVQVLDNLVSNAVKFSPPGSEVALGLEPMSGPGASRVRIFVTDNGPGLSREDQTRLFSEFTTLSARPTGQEHSLGLGLSIVKRVTEAMGGTVGYEPNPQGAGSRFYIALPAMA